MLCRCQLHSVALLLLVAHTKTVERKDSILIKVHFPLFSQICNLRNTADLPDFMLHRAFSIRSVKTVCCHNAIPHIMRGKSTCGSFQFVHLATETEADIVFYFSFLK